jgi:hypothetical protein
VPSCRTCAMAVVGVTLTVLFDGALRSAFAPIHMPIGTLPFCFAALVLMLAHDQIAGFEPVPLSAVSTPEDHLRAAYVRQDARASNSTHGKDDARVQTMEAADDAGRAPTTATAKTTTEKQPSPASVVSIGMISPAVDALPASPSYLARPPHPILPQSELTATLPTLPEAGCVSSAPSSPITGRRALRSLSIDVGTAVGGGSWHGGSNFTNMAHKIATISSAGGSPGGRAIELAFRAASAVGISPSKSAAVLTPSLSREGTNHGGENFSESLQSLIEQGVPPDVIEDGGEVGVPAAGERE